MKLFYTGPLVNAELLVTMLEKHGIAANQTFAEAEAGEGADVNEDDLSRLTNVFVPESDYARAHRLFYSEREDEL
jgi:hypothetical protein